MAQNVRLNSIKEVVVRTSLSRSTVYQEMASGRLRSVKVGNRRLITESALIDYIDNLSKEASQESGRDSTAFQGYTGRGEGVA
jgi:excisionase family DNA binding protein